MPMFKFYVSNEKKRRALAAELAQMETIPVYLGATFVQSTVSYEEAGRLAKKHGARLDEYHEKSLLKGWVR